MSDATFTTSRFCWWDLGTTDPEAAKKFYGEVFGWSPSENPMPEAGPYTILTKDGRDAAALYPLDEQMTAQGIPPHWQSYISVADVDEAVRRAKELNGKVLAEPFDVMDLGRQAVVADPTGAVFSMWQPKAHRGATLVDEIGGVCWNELATPDLAAAGEFYGTLFSWDREEMPMGPSSYLVMKSGEVSTAGGMQMDDRFEGIPPHWLPYFMVEDTEGAVDKARRLGADIRVEPKEIPEIGMFSVIQDPQGAVFAILGPNKSEH